MATAAAAGAMAITEMIRTVQSTPGLAGQVHEDIHRPWRDVGFSLPAHDPAQAGLHQPRPQVEVHG